jgi:hypothetical protein
LPFFSFPFLNFSLACPFMQLLHWLIAIFLSAGAGCWIFIADKRRAVPYPWLTALLRTLVVFFTLLLLLVPTFTITRNETQKPVVVLLQDNSRSIAPALGADSAIYRKNVQQLAANLSANYKVVQWGFGNTIRQDSLYQYDQQATDISAAMARVQDFYGLQNLGAVVLATDGRFNQGINPLYQQMALHGILYTAAIGDSTMQKDFRITQAYANKIVSLNSQFEIRADIVAVLCNGYNNNVQLTEAGASVGSAALTISTDRYDRAVSFTVKATKAGLHHYVINAPVADGEKNTANNRKDVFVEVVDEKKNILIVSAGPHPDVNAIRDALSGVETYKVTVRTADNLPSSLSDYQVIIVHGLPSSNTNLLPQLQGIKKPIWYILGAQENLAQLNQLQHLVKVSPAAPHDALASYNNAFNTFLLPQNTPAVVDKMPPLLTNAGAVQLAPNATVLLAQKGAEQIPVWCMQQGATPVAVLLGEGLWRWRLYEYKNYNEHTVTDECIRQTVAFLSANSNERPFQVVMPKYVWSDQEPVTLDAYLLNANNEQVNTPDATLTLTDSGGKKQNFSFERAGNTYRLNLGVWAGGGYNYTAHTTYNGKTYTVGGSFVVERVPVELMETGADYPLLYGLAKKYNGALVPAANIASLYDNITRNPLIKPVIQTNTETVPLVDWKWYFFLILALAVAEWLLRKYWLAQ